MSRARGGPAALERRWPAYVRRSRDARRRVYRAADVQRAPLPVRPHSVPAAACDLRAPGDVAGVCASCAGGAGGRALMSNLPRQIALVAPLSGILVPLECVPDPVFAQRTVGDGVSIDPTSSDVLAPAAGLVTLLHRAAHALVITTDEGVEILIHIGVDTIRLNGKGFTARVQQGDRVAAGQALISFDADLIARSAASLLTQVLVTNRERIRGMTVGSGLVDAGRSIILNVELAAAAPVEGAPATEATVVSGDIRLPNHQGLHARPAAVIAAASKAFRSDIRLLRGEEAANAKSVTAILLLATNPNDTIRVSATGPDAAAAVSALAELLASGSGEAEAVREGSVPAVGPVPAAAAAAIAPAGPTDPRRLAGVWGSARPA